METFNYHVLHFGIHHIENITYRIYSTNIVANRHRNELRDIYVATNLYTRAAMFADMWNALRDCFYFADCTCDCSNDNCADTL